MDLGEVGPSGELQPGLLSFMPGCGGRWVRAGVGGLFFLTSLSPVPRSRTLQAEVVVSMCGSRACVTGTGHSAHGPAVVLRSARHVSGPCTLGWPASPQTTKQKSPDWPEVAVAGKGHEGAKSSDWPGKQLGCAWDVAAVPQTTLWNIPQSAPALRPQTWGHGMVSVWIRATAQHPAQQDFQVAHPQSHAPRDTGSTICQ